MTFKEFVDKLEQRLGYHQIPFNPDATRIQDVLDSSPVHGDLVVRVLRAIYKQNGCQSLLHPVTQEKIDHALVPIRLDVLRSKKSDIYAVQLMDELCHAVKSITAHTKDSPINELPIPHNRRSNSVKKAAQIIPFNTYRRRLKSWA